MKPPIRFGILSFAHHHADFWAEAINELSTATLVGVWDDNADRGRSAAQRFGSRYYMNLGTLLQDCHAVGIASETTKHAALIEEAALAGVHILCEKPMAATLEDCDRIEKAVRASGVLYMQNFPKRFDPINQELIRLVRDGELGRIGLVRVRHANFHFLDTDISKQWFVDPKLAGGGALLDEGIHAVDFLRWMLGDPLRVSATVSSNIAQLPVDDTAVIFATFRSGALAEVSTSGTVLAAECSVEVHGSAGSAVVSGVDLASRDFSNAPYLRVFSKGNPRGRWDAAPTKPMFATDGFHKQGPKYFVNEFLIGNADAPGIVEGRKSLEIVLAAYRSARSQCHIDLGTRRESS